MPKVVGIKDFLGYKRLSMFCLNYYKPRPYSKQEFLSLNNLSSQSLISCTVKLKTMGFNSVVVHGDTGSPYPTLKLDAV